MSLSLKLTDAAAYQAYVETFGEELISQLFFGFNTAQLVSTHDEVKGRKVLTELVIGDNLVKRWRAAHDAVADAIDFQPRVLATAFAKLDVSVIPQELESTYLGMMRKKGQDPRDFPFEAYILGRLIAKAHQEMEVAAWQGIEKAVPAALDNLIELFDGYLHLIADAITATDLTVTTTGAITATNIVDSVELVYDALDTAYKSTPTTAFVSVRNFIRYQRRYRNEIGKYTEPVQLRQKLDFADCTIVGVPGMGSSNRIIITPAENLHLGYDDVSDYNMFNFEQNKRQLDFWMDFKMGVQIAQLRDGVMAVNEQT
jgi:hypothetical protein